MFDFHKSIKITIMSLELMIKVFSDIEINKNNKKNKKGNKILLMISRTVVFC